MNIVVYDSGQGGRAVFNLLEKAFQSANLNHSLGYFADHKHYPYGTKTTRELESIIQSNLKNFQDQGFDLVVVACNTASSVVDQMNLDLQIDVLTIINPTLSAVLNRKARPVYVIATDFVCQNHTYSKRLQKLEPEIEVIESSQQALIHAIETNDQSSIDNLLQKVIDQLPFKCLLVLGCTHFSLLKSQIAKKVELSQKKIEIIDSAEMLAKLVFLKVQG